MASKQEMTRNEHYVAQVHLKEFEIKSSLQRKHKKHFVIRYDLSSSNYTNGEEGVPTDSIGYKRDIYELVDGDGNFILPNAIEKFLGTMEGEFSKQVKWLKKKIKYGSGSSLFLTNPKRILWIKYIVTQMLRHPSVVQTARDVCRKYCENDTHAHNLGLLELFPYFENLPLRSSPFQWDFLKGFQNATVVVWHREGENFYTSDRALHCESCSPRPEDWTFVFFPVTPDIVIGLYNPSYFPREQRNKYKNRFVELTDGRLQYTEQFGTGLADRHVRSCHACCRTALERAVKDGLIHQNPSEGCKLPPKKSREMQVLLPDEITRFLPEAKAEGYYELFLLELSTGMRRGEILGLKWRDVNLKTGEMRINRSVTRVKGKTCVTPPKTKSSVRTIVLPPYMTALLVKMKETVDSEWIFPSPINPTEPRNPSAIYHRCQLILERANCKRVRFHDLRHTFATMAIENGMDVKTLSDMIGHTSSETTPNIYSHITDTMRVQAAARIDRKIGGTDAPIPEGKPKHTPPPCRTTGAEYEPYKPKCRKPGTGCVYQVNETLWEGSFYPRMPDGKRKKFNVYAKTREECETALAEMIAEKKKEIAESKATA